MQESISEETELNNLVASIEKKFGVGAIMGAGSGRCMPGIKYFTSQILGFDRVLGRGWARSRVHEIYGPESSGKTTLALHALAGIQDEGGRGAFVDAEHALDISYAKNLGVNTDDLLISQPDSGEQALEITEHLVRSRIIDLIIIDSVAALVPRAEIEGEMGDAHMGLQARLMSQAMRKLTGIVNRTGTTIIFINQIRMKIGVMFGSPETTAGGQALKFYSSQRVDIRRRSIIKKDNQPTGNETKIKCVKNKVASPFGEVEVIINYGKGIDIDMDILRQAVNFNIIDKAGSWYSYKNDRLGQGELKACSIIREDSILKNKILSELKPAMDLV